MRKGKMLGTGRIDGRATRVLSVLGRALLAFGLAGCAGESSNFTANSAESCMKCHNASSKNDYAGPGIENPHPYGDEETSNLACTTCHGGNPAGADKDSSHVPPPPEIGDREFQRTNRLAYFNRLTLTGIDKFDDYTVDGVTYSAIDYLQFINPGDLRVVTQERSCGECHEGHAECVAGSLLATEGGMLSGALFAAGVENQVPENQGLYQDTAADVAFRAVTNPNFDPTGAGLGEVGRLIEFPVFSARNDDSENAIHNNVELYGAAGLSDDLNADGSVITGSPLANLYHEQVAFTCGDCHLGSAGANNRTGDYRSSGCTSCHMPYSMGGRSGSRDPNVDKNEPLDPDDIDEPERAHVRAHRIISTAKTLPGGEFQPGIDDYACAGCHQGSNRTVMQYWGIRLDQNQDLRRGVQFPAAPVSFRNTGGDERLFDPDLGNLEFNGRNANQYILFEDYDGDERDDTPPDVHYDAGLGCIDCHGSFDLHGGDVTAGHTDIVSRMDQAVAIRCESCHGPGSGYAETAMGTAFNGEEAELAVDANGNPLNHVIKESDGHFYLYSKLTGEKHFVRQTYDTIVDTGKTNPLSDSENPEPIYSERASYAMGRADGDPSTGIGPLQTAHGGDLPGFSHADNVSCSACHSSWTNTCIGCHLEGEYNTGNNFSNITGERIVFREDEADFVYQNPVHFQLGVDTDNKVAVITPNTKVFFSYRDQNNELSETFAFSDRNASGSNPAQGFPALGHNVMMPHSIRGKVSPEKEGPRYCAACHLTEEGLDSFGSEYDTFRTAMANDDFESLDFSLLQTHIGRNPGNELNSPLWVHMAAGLGSGLYLFDEDGCPINPLDFDNDRKGCDDVAPANKFDLSRVRYNLDRIVDENGVSKASNNHPMAVTEGDENRDGSTDALVAGPLGATLVRRLTDPVNGIVLDSWIGASGDLHGEAADYLEGGLPPSGTGPIPLPE